MQFFYTKFIINIQEVRIFQIMTAIEKKSPTMFIFQCTHLHLNQCFKGNIHKGYDFKLETTFSTIVHWSIYGCFRFVSR